MPCCCTRTPGSAGIPGVNPVSLLRGAWSTYGSGAARIGGSTITMQLARLRWRLDTRASARQAGADRCARCSWKRCYGKDEILEAYLNLAPYGGNIEGVGAASQIYFRKPAGAADPARGADAGGAAAGAVAARPPAPRSRSRREPISATGCEAARARLYARWREAARQRPGAATR